MRIHRKSVSPSSYTPYYCLLIYSIRKRNKSLFGDNCGKLDFTESGAPVNEYTAEDLKRQYAAHQYAQLEGDDEWEIYEWRDRQQRREEDTEMSKLTEELRLTNKSVLRLRP
jgi:hypothetical protein